MFKKAQTTFSLTACAHKGEEIGRVRDLMIDGSSWAVRYIDIAAEVWWPGRHIFISPDSVASVDWRNETLKLNLTVKQIDASPFVEHEAALSREDEQRLADHYGWPQTSDAMPVSEGASGGSQSSLYRLWNRLYRYRV